MRSVWVRDNARDTRRYARYTIYNARHRKRGARRAMSRVHEWLAIYGGELSQVNAGSDNLDDLRN